MEENNNVEVTSSVTNVEQPPVEETNASVVEPKTKKGGSGIIILLVLLILGLAGYICYDKFMAPKPSVKCNANSTDTGNKDLKEEKVQIVKYTYEDLAGYYYFSKLIEERGEDYDAEIYLNEDGTIRFENGPDASYGYVGNYIIDGDTIKVTIWFDTGSYSDLRLVEKSESTETIKINTNSSITLSECYSGTFKNCEFKKDDVSKRAKISSDSIFEINSFLNEEHFISGWKNE